MKKKNPAPHPTKSPDRRRHLSTTVDPLTLEIIDSICREHGISRGQAIDRMSDAFIEWEEDQVAKKEKTWKQKASRSARKSVQ